MIFCWGSGVIKPWCIFLLCSFFHISTIPSSHRPAEQVQLPGFAQGFGIDGTIKEIVAQRPEFDRLFDRPPQSPRSEDPVSELGAVTPRSMARVAFRSSLRRQARSAPCSRDHSPASRVASRSPVRTAETTDHPCSPSTDTVVVSVPCQNDPSHGQGQVSLGTSQARATEVDWNEVASPTRTQAGRFKKGDSQVCGAICCVLCTMSAIGGGIWAIVEYA